MTPTTPSTVAFVGYLAHKYPTLGDIFNEHYEFNNQDILPHPLISDYLRDIETSDMALDWHRAFFDDIESAFSMGDCDLTGLISVSLLEHLPCNKNGLATDHWIIGLIGPKCLKKYKCIFGLRKRIFGLR